MEQELKPKKTLRLSDDHIAKRYYTIQEVAEVLQVNASAIRYWEKMFNIAPTHKAAGNRRRYTKAELARMQQVHQLLKQDKLSIVEAREELLKPKPAAQPPLPPKEMLQKVKFFLEQLRDSL